MLFKEEVSKRDTYPKIPKMMTFCAHSNICCPHVAEMMADTYSENYLQYKKSLSAFWSSRDEAFTLKVDAYFETLFTRKHRTVKGYISF